MLFIPPTRTPQTHPTPAKDPDSHQLLEQADGPVGLNEAETTGGAQPSELSIPASTKPLSTRSSQTLGSDLRKVSIRQHADPPGILPVHNRKPKPTKKVSTMPHPILKKTRGPSNNGPRPTARFISPDQTPHESPAISDSEPSEPEDVVSPNSHVVVRPPTPDWQDTESDSKAGAKGMKGKKRGHGFVVGAGKNRKRPSLIRRKSSQSSTNSDTVRKAPPQKKTLLGRNLADVSGVASTRGPIDASSKSQEDFLPSPPKKYQTQADISKLENPKNRVNLDHRLTGSTKTGSEPQIRPNARQHSLIEPGPSKQSKPPGRDSAEESRDSQSTLNEEEAREVELQKLLLDEATARKKAREAKCPAREDEKNSKSSSATAKSHRSRSTGDAIGLQNIAVLALHPTDVKGSPSLAPNYAAATGRIDLYDRDFDYQKQGQGDKGKGRDLEEVDRLYKEAEKSRGLFPKRPVQSRPSSSSTSSVFSGHNTDGGGGLSRSKSQLTLLLEKDRALTREQKQREKARLGSTTSGTPNEQVGLKRRAEEKRPARKGT
jgi:hypothetical protein